MKTFAPSPAARHFVADQNVLRLDAAVDDGRPFPMGLGNSPAKVLRQIRSGFERHKLATMRVSELFQTAARKVLHREVTADAARRLQDVRVKYPHDVRMPDAQEQNGFAGHVVNLVEAPPCA